MLKSEVLENDDVTIINVINPSRPGCTQASLSPVIDAFSKTLFQISRATECERGMK